MSKTVIAIIGAGNIGQCLLGGLIANQYSKNTIWITNPSPAKLAPLKDMFHVHTTTDNREACQQADILLFAVKPSVLPHIIQECKDIIQSRKPLIISVAAGISIATIQHGLEATVPIVRCMPNTPALIGCGATALFANAAVSHAERNTVESILRTLGMVLWLDDEKLMNPVTALSGCGPAYFFSVINALQSAGEALGLPSDIARLLTLQTAYGSARMALESNKTVATLIAEVASPGGSTVEALRVFKENNFDTIFLAALKAANQRAVEREQQFESTMGPTL